MIDKLNSQQQAAVLHTSGPLLVIAGAGSGKTRVIIHKIAHLIHTETVLPAHIYAVTFTNKAAKEMQTRTQEVLKTGKKIAISTFHALGLQILKKENKNAHFTLFDTLDSLTLLKALSEALAPLNEDRSKSIHQMISGWKNRLISPSQALQTAESEEDHLAARFFVAYEEKLRAYNALDFDDLIGLPVQLFQENLACLERWQNHIRYLLVDEYQDTNVAQYELIRLLCHMRQALMVVGDDDQSIYAWRGANPENIFRLQKDFSGLTVIKLEQNYRSTDTILRAANHLISHNPHLFEKQLWSTLGEGEPIRVVATADEQEESERIVHELISHQFRYRKTFDHYAVLYRSNYQAKLLEKALREQGIPYHISGGDSFFARTEIKDLFAYFRLVCNQNDDAAFLRCVNTPPREIGPATLEKLGHYAKTRQTSLFYASLEMGLGEWLSPQAQARLTAFSERILQLSEEVKADQPIEIVHAFVEEIGYKDYLKENAPTPKSAEKRIGHVDELLQWIARLLNRVDTPLSFQEAIQRMALLDMLDRQSAEKATGVVQLMTLHTVKGLEFPYVFIMGWEEDLLPHKNSIAFDTIEEERRLAYVGMTRARENLVLTYAKTRKRFGEYHPSTPSRFLKELPPALIQWEGEAGQAPSPEKQRAVGQAHLDVLKALLQDAQ